MGAASVLALLTACGGSDGGDEGGDDGGDSSFADESVDTIVEEATKAMQALDSLQLAGELTSDGQKISLDMTVTTDGDCEGTIGLAEGQAELVSVGGESWFKPDEAFWRSFAGPQADQIIGVVGSNWVLLPPEESGFTELCDLDELLDELDRDDDNKLTKAGTEEIDGQETVIIEGESTEDADNITQAWVATEGEHYILQVGGSGEDEGTISFSGFNEDVDIQAPPDDEVVDLSQAG